MNTINIRSTKKVEPKCYAYTTPEVQRHEGWTKIGYTEQDDVEVRIRQQTQTVDVRYCLEWHESARFADGTVFHDKAFHRYLGKKEVEREGNSEWFHLVPKVAHGHFREFTRNRGVLQTPGAVPYVLRAEQAEAVERTRLYMASHAGQSPEFLWNAKPRFGKTLAAYDLCKQMGARTVLIVTNRPAIAHSWYDDYVRFMGSESGYYFISGADALRGLPHVLERAQLPSDAEGYIEFVSLQDLKGSLYFGGEFDKLEHVQKLTWDLLIVDEAHEGVDTYRADVAFEQIARRATLHLSGTPFKALANEKFEEKAIFNWTYADEQRAKREWQEEAEEENPYAALPQLHLYTYRMSEVVRDRLKQGADFDDDGENEAYAFDLNEFFATKSDGSFKYDEAVERFLEALAGQEKFPFSTEALRREVKHSFWLLDRVDSAKALAKKLKAHPVFREYEVVVAAGDGKTDAEEEATSTLKSLDKVRTAIRAHERTITLSVGQLTTGVTVPEWTAVLMLSNVKSPSLYMQAAFRAQNPCLFVEGDELRRKENAYVFDFEPARTLVIFEQFANDLCSATVSGGGDGETRKRQVRELLNFFPVYGEDEEGEMVALDAEKVLSVPRKIYAVEVVRRGFMSNFLFQNIGNIFSAPRQVADILGQLPTVKEQKPSKAKEGGQGEGGLLDGAADLPLNEKGEVVLPLDELTRKTGELFGDKIYSDNVVTQTKIDEVSTSNAPDKKAAQNLVTILVDTVVNPTLQDAKTHYGDEMSRASEHRLKKQLQNQATVAVGKAATTHKKNRHETEKAKKRALDEAHAKGQSEAEVQAIQDRFDAEQRENERRYREELKEAAAEIEKKAKQAVVDTVETEKVTRKKEAIEEDIRGHLRGFARTIPAFLMAYGDENTCLDNFDTILPDEVFREVTGISLEQFRILRDGCDYEDEGVRKHFDGHCFDPIVFDDAVQEFLALKKKLGNYFDESQSEDIFDYIPPQKTNQIFTPKHLVMKMVNMLEEESPGCFDDPDKTFIDLYMKSGLYVAEIVKRLFRSEAMKARFPQAEERLRHIFAHQVYGLAPTEIIYRIACAFVLGFDEELRIERHHLARFDALPAVKDGTLEEALDKIWER